MIRRFLFILILLGIFISCDDSFNPFGEYKDKFVLTCIIRADSTKQVTTISKSYENENSQIQGEVNWIKGAEVTVWQEDSVYVFKDSSAIIDDPVYGQIQIEFYYHPYLKLLPNKLLEIEALLPSGKRLKSSGYSPKQILFNSVSSSTVIPPVKTKNYEIAWNTVSSGTIYDIKFQIKYIKKINGANEEFMIEVPTEYVINNNTETPLYPIPSRNTSSVFNIEAITRTMQLISGDDPKKSDYTVDPNPIIEVIAMDEGLSRYFSTSSGSFDDLTVRVNNADYTNVEGGYGVFGSYIKSSYTSGRLLPEYIESFGYNVKLDN